MSETSIATTDALSVAYARGQITALADVTVHLDEGIVGLVGANGAGKTTLLRCLSGAISPTSGRVTLRSRDARTYRQREVVGSIPAQPRFPAYLSVGAFLDGLRAVIGGAAATESELALAEAFELGALRHRLLNTLSLGQARRVEIVAALIGDPDLLLLDEPTNGLDPIAMAHLRAGLLAARRRGRCIVVSSHHLDELQRIADRVLFVREGKLIGAYTAAEVAERGGSIESLFLATERAGNG